MRLLTTLVCMSVAVALVASQMTYSLPMPAGATPSINAGIVHLSNGDVVWADRPLNCLFLANASNNHVSTVWAGVCGSQGYADGPSLQAQLDAHHMAVYNDAVFFINSDPTRTIRKVQNGVVSTVLPTVSTAYGFMDRLGFDAQGNLYVSTAVEGSLYRINLPSVTVDHVISGVADPMIDYSPDGLGASVYINRLADILFHPNGLAYMSETNLNVVRTFNPATTYVETVCGVYAGYNVGGFADGPCSTARFNKLGNMALDNQFNILISDVDNRRIRRIDISTGVIDTIVGSGAYGFVNGDPPTSAKLTFATSISTYFPTDRLTWLEPFGMREVGALAVPPTPPPTPYPTAQTLPPDLGGAPVPPTPNPPPNTWITWPPSLTGPPTPAPPPPTPAPPTPQPPNLCTGPCLQYVCPQGSTVTVNVVGAIAGTVWGTNFFTDDSDVPTSAVHYGEVVVGQFKQVTAICTGPQNAFQGSTANGVTSQNFNFWPASYTFGPPSTPPPAPPICYQEPCAQGLCNVLGHTFTIIVTGSTLSAQAWGTAIYSDDTWVGVAAVHQGLLLPNAQGAVVVQCMGSQTSFTGTAANGVTTQSFGPWPFSYSLTAGPPAPPAPHPHECQGACLEGVCPAGSTRRILVTGTTYGYLWGTNEYSDDTTVGAAAVHIGVLVPGQTTELEATCLGPQTSFFGSLSNGVNSQSFGPYPASFSLAVAPTPTPTACSGACMTGLCQVMPGEVFHLTVTGTTTGQVWGTSIYTDDSAVDAAAVHDGLIQSGQTGTIRVICRESLAAYVGSNANGVTSMPFGTWPRSWALIL